MLDHSGLDGQTKCTRIADGTVAGARYSLRVFNVIVIDDLQIQDRDPPQCLKLQSCCSSVYVIVCTLVLHPGQFILIQQESHSRNGDGLSVPANQISITDQIKEESGIVRLCDYATAHPLLVTQRVVMYPI